MSLVALALPQPPLRMKITMAEKSDLSPTGEVPVVYHESEPVPPTTTTTTSSGKKDKKDKSKHKKNQRKNEATKTLAHTSVTASISIALSDPNALLIRSAPSSPEFLKPRRHFKLRNRSKGVAASSDPESSSCASVSPSPSPSPLSSPNRRPLFLWPRKKGKKSGSRDALNGPKTPGSRPESPNVIDSRYGSGSSIEPEATPAITLPGGRPSKLEMRHSGGEIPTIFVSHDEHNGCGACGGSDALQDETRKMSQTSVGSNVNSANSGYCTLSAAGSGDEAGSFSDLDYPSPVSPSSMTSSPGGSVPNIALMSTEASSTTSKRTSSCGGRGSVLSPDSEPDYSHQEHRDAQSPVATPTTPLSAPFTGMSISPLPGPRGVSPPMEGSSAKSPGRIRDPYKKRGPWEKVRKFVQALSPFTLQFNKKKYAWVQLAGHQDSFRPGEKAGSIQKKSDQNECSALKALSMDAILRPFVPEYNQTVIKDGQLFVEMSDLLREFTDPAVMDIKMGVRTYLEDELEKARTKKVLRQDMYKKMVEIDPAEPTEEEHAQQAITKPRYMQWRETISSSSSLGFRIEGIKTSEGNSLKDFKTTKLEYDVKCALRDFISENPCVKEPFLRRLCDIRAAMEQSEFFRKHEVCTHTHTHTLSLSPLPPINLYTDT
jgi:1D-myo-inositol-triphosphate 3-kinase